LSPIAYIVPSMDIFGTKAKLRTVELQAQLDAERTSRAAERNAFEALLAARSEDVDKVAKLLNSTIFKLISLTDRDAARLVKNAEEPEKEQKPLPPNPFLRRTSIGRVVRQTRENLNNASTSE
jgi:hypothetical protein